MTRKGINYYYLRNTYHDVLPKPSLESPRVFISHQKKDSEIARKIADYFEEAGVDIYFDQYDGSINRSDPSSVVKAIRYGIENSTHMLVVFSHNIFGSMWVPWEIGYAYNSHVSLNVLRLKGVPKDQLPEYLRVVKVILDIWDLNQMISNLTNDNRDRLVEEGRIRVYSDPNHPLSQYLDSNAGTF